MSQQSSNYGGRVTSDAQQALAEISGHYAIIPEALLDTHNGAAILLYGILDRIANRGEGFASMTILSKRTGQSQQTIRRARQFLVDEGWLEIVRVGSGRLATDYRLPFQMNRGRGTKLDTPGMPECAYQPEPYNRALKESPIPDKETQAKALKKPKIEIDDAFRQAMKERFGSKLTDIDERIDEALAHDAATKYKDLPRYVTGWLRRDAERQPHNASFNSRATRQEPSNDLERFGKEF